MKNKKAQIEKAVTFPVLIMIVVIIGIFLLLSVAIAKKNPVNTWEAITPIPSENLLLQVVTVDLESGSEEVLVHDALSLMIQGKIKEEYLRLKLASLLTQENNCYLLIDVYSSEGGTGAAERVWGQGIDSENRLIDINNYENYKNQNKLTPILIKNFNIERPYEYYYGRCL